MCLGPEMGRAMTQNAGYMVRAPIFGRKPSEESITLSNKILNKSNEIGTVRKQTPSSAGASPISDLIPASYGVTEQQGALGVNPKQGIASAAQGVKIYG